LNACALNRKRKRLGEHILCGSVSGRVVMGSSSKSRGMLVKLNSSDRLERTETVALIQPTDQFYCYTIVQVYLLFL
jgi:hypothetical protein